MRDRNGNFVDMFPPSNPTPRNTRPTIHTRPFVNPNPPIVADQVVQRTKTGPSGMAADAYVEQHSAKRLVQTSARYPSAVEALEACEGLKHSDYCDYAYVTEDNRTVGIFDYYDVTPDQPVKSGQKRVRIPMFQKQRDLSKLPMKEGDYSFSASPMGQLSLQRLAQQQADEPPKED